MLVDAQETDSESEVKPAKHLTFGKLVLGVALGVLLAASIAAIVYYFSTELPRENSARREAEVRAAQSLRQMQNQSDALDAENVDTEQKIRELQPGSPCNRLTGNVFLSCNDLKTTAEKKKFVAASLAQDKRPDSPCYPLAGDARTMCLHMTPEQQKNYVASALAQHSKSSN